MKSYCSSLALIVVSVVALPVHGAVLIDDFTTFQSVVQSCATIGTPVGSTVIGGGILGGERDVRLDMTFCPGVGDLQVLVTSYFHSADAGVRGTSLAAWDGMDGDGLVVDPTGLGGVDLTEGGTQDAFQILIQQADLNSLLVFEVFTDGTNSSTFTLNLVGGALNTDLVIPYASFVPNLGSGADFTNAGAITMLIDGSAVSSLDVIVDFLGTTSTLTAIKTGALLIDSDFDGLIEAGETIRYTITISNPDDDQNATTLGVIFNDTPDPNTNLVVGSVTTSQGSVTTGNSGGDTDISVDIGDIVDGGTVTITFDVVVKPGPVDEVCNQGFVSHAFERPIGGGFNLPTDDPSTPEPNDPTCLPVAYCGDGIVDPTDEQCDDGNTDNNDDCSNDCTQGCGNDIVNTGEACDGADAGMIGCAAEASGQSNACRGNCTCCGDGRLDAGEDCDDGNTTNGDGCNDACVFVCGDNDVNQASETCDGTDAATCNSACRGNCTCCGDGNVDAGEDCDDGNTTDGDGCNNACLFVCGDNDVNQPSETCDGTDASTCNSACRANCTCCGDGITDAGEECDDGNNVGGDGCTAACVREFCGNNVLDPGEVCDGAQNAACASGVCLPDCSCEDVQGLCGNGILDAGEECDGAANAACGGGFCRPDCTCGDEIPTVSEWGIAVLALLLLTAAKLRFTERRTV